MSVDERLVADVRACLADHADPVRAEPMRRYLKSTLPCLGLPMPVLRRAVRPLIAEGPTLGRASWEATIRALYADPAYREERYAALELAGHRRYRDHRDVDALPLLAWLAVEGAWWDLVDGTAGIVDEVLRTHPDDARAVVRTWATADDLWVRRMAIIGQLRARADTDLDLLTYAIDRNLEGSAFGRAFFIRKAIGWALRQHARTDPDWVRSFVAARHDQMSGLTRREALKHL